MHRPELKVHASVSRTHVQRGQLELSTRAQEWSSGAYLWVARREIARACSLHRMPHCHLGLMSIIPHGWAGTLGISA
jgi:hypothetical protein